MLALYSTALFFTSTLRASYFGHVDQNSRETDLLTQALGLGVPPHVQLNDKISCNDTERVLSERLRLEAIADQL